MAGIAARAVHAFLRAGERVALKMALAQEMQLPLLPENVSEQAAAIATARQTPALIRVILLQYIAYDLYGKHLKTPQSAKAKHAFGEAMRELLGMEHIVETNDAPFAMKMYVAAYTIFPDLRDTLAAKFLLTPGSVARTVRAALRTAPVHGGPHGEAHAAEREALAC